MTSPRDHVMETMAALAARSSQKDVTILLAASELSTVEVVLSSTNLDKDSQDRTMSFLIRHVCRSIGVPEQVVIDAMERIMKISIAAIMMEIKK